MKNSVSNIQITATAAEFKNGKNGYTVLVKGLDDKLNCKMNFTEPLKAMRYMFVLAKRLKLQVNTIDLAAVQLDYLRAKQSLDNAAEEVANTVKAVEQEEADAEPTDAEPSPSGVEELPTMEKQFRDLKKKHPEALLLFRCGDFYETYHDDAADAAKILGITLTVRAADKTRMAGFPHHALDTYLPKLIRAGKRVAICDAITTSKVVAK